MYYIHVYTLFYSLTISQLKVSESVNTLAKVLASVNDQVCIYTSLFNATILFTIIIVLFVSFKTFGQKDVFMSEALKQLGKYVAEVLSLLVHPLNHL